MKKLLALCFLSVVLLGISSAQTTALSATVVDSDGTTWANGTWSINFKPGPGFFSPSQYKINGASLDPAVYSQNGTLNGSGVLAVTVYDSSVVTPFGSGWTLSVCSNTSAPCSAYQFSTAGASQNISAALTASITAPRFIARSGTYGYNDGEAANQLVVGATYYNVTTPGQRCYSGSAWAACSSGSPYPGCTPDGSNGVFCAGNVASGTACPASAPAGSVCANGNVTIGSSSLAVSAMLPATLTVLCEGDSRTAGTAIGGASVSWCSTGVLGSTNLIGTRAGTSIYDDAVSGEYMANYVTQYTSVTSPVHVATGKTMQQWCQTSTVTNPVLLFLWTGYNDIRFQGTSASALVSAYTSYMTQAKTDGCTPVAMTDMAGIAPQIAAYSASEQQFNALLKGTSLSGSTPWSQLIDLDSLDIDPADPTLMNGDNIHQSATAQYLIANLINTTFGGAAASKGHATSRPVPSNISASYGWGYNNLNSQSGIIWLNNGASVFDTTSIVTRFTGTNFCLVTSLISSVCPFSGNAAAFGAASIYLLNSNTAYTYQDTAATVSRHVTWPDFAGTPALMPNSTAIISPAALGTDASGHIIAGTVTGTGGTVVLSAGPTLTGTVTIPKVTTTTNCANAASPAVCGSAAAGAVTIAAGSTTVTVNTTAITAASEIFIQTDDSVTIAATTCNSTLATLVGGIAVTARTVSTSFQITFNGVIATNPLCISYHIVN